MSAIDSPIILYLLIQKIHFFGPTINCTVEWFKVGPRHFLFPAWRNSFFQTGFCHQSLEDYPAKCIEISSRPNEHAAFMLSLGDLRFSSPEDMTLTP
jgi:hypothetical protein